MIVIIKFKKIQIFMLLSLLELVFSKSVLLAFYDGFEPS